MGYEAYFDVPNQEGLTRIQYEIEIHLAANPTRQLSSQLDWLRRM